MHIIVKEFKKKLWIVTALQKHLRMAVEWATSPPWILVSSVTIELLRTDIPSQLRVTEWQHTCIICMCSLHNMAFCQWSKNNPKYASNTFIGLFKLFRELLKSCYRFRLFTVRQITLVTFVFIYNTTEEKDCDWNNSERSRVPSLQQGERTDIPLHTSVACNKVRFLL